MTTLDAIEAAPVVADEPASAGIAGASRVAVRGKFFFAGDQKLYVRGVTYGPFRPDAEGCEYHTPDAVAQDFEQMAAAGINTVRTYTVPPRWLLDIAQRCGLRVMVGLPWEQHITFLDSRRQRNSIEQRVRAGVRQCAHHPALLCFAIGNEIPASIVRWYGRRRMERFLTRLCGAVKAEDPQALVTYVNFPTTEYLNLPCLDLVAFNVYLESEEKFSGYLARLQNLAGNRPLLMAEIGLDSYRNSEQQQAETLDWQIRTAFAEGCCGTFVFSWTDEWHRGGQDIADWGFGLTDRDRCPKPALDTVARRYADAPFPAEAAWPSISVVVCTYNGSATIEQTCGELDRLDYPDYEIIVVNDGSTDRTPEILERACCRVIHLPNGGLSNARNVGMKAARGEIVAYIDDDAFPDPHWLRYLAWTFMTRDFAAVGGPNLLPLEDGWRAECVVHAPGGPTHVLLSDRVAEHIPGCNMAFRKAALEAAGGFDPRYLIAGDDVDACWRLQAQGHVIGFHPAAVVWHYRRNSLARYLRQQHNYGWAEGLLEAQWPQKYNSFGHVSWRGRIYGDGRMPSLAARPRIYHGVWGSAAFQSIYTQPVHGLQTLPLMPEWHLLTAALLGVSLLGLLWTPLLLTLPLLMLTLLVSIGQAAFAATQPVLRESAKHSRLKRRALIALMHLLQPIVRLKGRLHCGLAPWRRPRPSRKALSLVLPRPRRQALWDEQWNAPEARLTTFETRLQQMGAYVRRGDSFDRWDLAVAGGIFGGLRLLMTVEEHGSGHQLVRLQSWPWWHRSVAILLVSFPALAVMAGYFGSWGTASVLAVLTLGLAVRAVGDYAVAAATCVEAIQPDTPRPAERALAEAALPVTEPEQVGQRRHAADRQARDLEDRAPLSVGRADAHTLARQ